MTGESTLARLLGVRPGEGTRVGLAVAASFFASAGLMIGQSGIEALFFARFGVSRLPVMYLVLGGTMVALTIVFGTLIGRLGRGRACLLIPVVLAVAAAAGRLALAADVAWITQALWLLQAAAQFLLGLSVWGLAGLVTDTRQAKRFFPLIGAGGVLGYVLGGLATKPLASAIGSPDLLVVWIGTLVVVAVLGARLTAIGDTERPRRGRSRRRTDPGPVEQLARGFRYARRSRLMRWMALGSILFSLLFFSLYLPFSRAATERYPDPDELAGFFGVFFGLSTGVAFLLSLFVTNRLLARFGVPAVMLVLPVVYLVAFGVLAVDATFTLLAVFRFTQVAWLSGGAVSATEAVINSVPPDRRDQIRAFLYGGPTQVGTVLAGVIALVGDGLPAATLYGIGFVGAALATIAMLGVRRAYPRELVQALREGRPHVFDVEPTGASPLGPDHADRSAVTAAVEASTDLDPRVRRVAAHVLGDLDAADASAPLLACLDDDDAGVRATAIESIARLGRPEPLAAVLGRVDDPDPAVRRAAIDAACALGAADAGARRAVEAARSDPDPSVRAGAAAALLRVGAATEGLATLAELSTDADQQVRREAFAAMRVPEIDALADLAIAGLSDPAPIVRVEAAEALGRLAPPRAMPALVGALGDRQRAVRDAAAEALGRLGAAAGDAVVDSLAVPDRCEGAVHALASVPLDGRADDVRRFASAMVDRAADSHRAAVAVGDASGDERLALLRDSLLARSDRLAMLGLRAADALDGRHSMSVALESLSVTDPSQRANALEVIESVGARDVVAPLIAMWDGAPATGDRESLLDELARDDDEWIRACVALVSTTAPSEGATMTRSITTLSPMERVLSLRTVSLFAGLPPADLLPIAQITEEHTFADGDRIAEQGEIGDAMFVILRGEVSVVQRGEHDGSDERVVAIRSAGEAVGEMAVITDERRIAGLVARGDVRVLSIARPQFESILRERPETALAVIRVLCQRLTESAASAPGPEATGSTTTSSG